jgi:hypothetical protein
MNLDLSKFKKVREDSHKAILKHQDGHEIHLSKGKLKTNEQKDLSSLPMHFDVGGSVPDNSDQQSQQQPQQPTVIINNSPPQQPQPQAQSAPPQPHDYMTNGTFDTNKFILQNQGAPVSSKIDVLKQQQGMQQVQQNAEKIKAQQAADQSAQIAEYNKLAAEQGAPTIADPNGSAQMPTPSDVIKQNGAPQGQDSGAQVPAQPQQPQQPNDPFGNEAYLNAYGQGLENKKLGIMGEAEAQAKAGKEQAAYYNQAANQTQQALGDYKSNWQSLTDEYNKFKSDLGNQHIDANHYLNNMNGGQKISTAIGLILGGMGAGLTHTSNPVLDHIHRQIDNDINAQKENLGIKRSLLDANLKQFGNLRDATDMTRLMTNEIVSNQIKMAAAKQADPLARARALQAAGDLDIQSAPIISQLAMRRTLMNQTQNGKIDPATYIRMVVPEGQQQAAYKELGEAQEASKARDNALHSFDEMNNLNTVGNRIGSPIQSKSRVDALRNNLAVQIARASAGRVNEYEFEAAKQLFPKPGDDEKTIQLKRTQLNKFMNEKMNYPMLKSYPGLMPQPGQYNDVGASRIQESAPNLK